MISQITDAGFCVLRFDNRDSGKSEKFDHLPKKQIIWHVLKLAVGLSPKPHYTLIEMKEDALGLLDALNIRRAHIVGISMGGMIAQLMSIHAPDRVISLTSMMSTTGNRKLPNADLDILKHLMSKPKSTAYQDLLEHHTKTYQLIQNAKHPARIEELRKSVEINLNHGMSLSGSARQLLAILSAPDRTLLLRSLNIPALIIHGEADRLVKIPAGLATAANIPNAKLHVIKDLAHNLPEPLQNEIARKIIEHIR
jgi:pimeloyl-ACP methyl ester carboxylesterase